MAPRVLISDKLSPLAEKVFTGRGIEVDVKVGLDKAELAEIIGDYQGLAVRSATKATTTGGYISNPSTPTLTTCPKLSKP